MQFKSGKLYKFKKNHPLFVSPNNDSTVIKYTIKSETPFMFVEATEEMRLKNVDGDFIKILYENKLGWTFCGDSSLIEEF